MSNGISAKISKKSKWWISENRHRELMYFCLQYKEWRAVVNSVSAGGASIVERKPDGGNISRSVEAEVIRREKYQRKMHAVELACEYADPELAKYLFKAVTEGHKYDYMRGMLDIPCGRRQFYEKIRKVFWALDGILDE